MKKADRRWVQARPERSSCSSISRCRRNMATGESAAAPSTESFTTCFTPARRAASTTASCISTMRLSTGLIRSTWLISRIALLTETGRPQISGDDFNAREPKLPGPSRVSGQGANLDSAAHQLPHCRETHIAGGSRNQDVSLHRPPLFSQRLARHPPAIPRPAQPRPERTRVQRPTS